MAKVETKILNMVENAISYVEEKRQHCRKYWEEGIWLNITMSKY